MNEREQTAQEDALRKVSGKRDRNMLRSKASDRQERTKIVEAKILHGLESILPN